MNCNTKSCGGYTIFFIIRILPSCGALWTPPLLSHECSYVLAWVDWHLSVYIGLGGMGAVSNQCHSATASGFNFRSTIRIKRKEIGGINTAMHYRTQAEKPPNEVAWTTNRSSLGSKRNKTYEYVCGIHLFGLFLFASAVDLLHSCLSPAQVL